MRDPRADRVLVQIVQRDFLLIVPNGSSLATFLPEGLLWANSFRRRKEETKVEGRLQTLPTKTARSRRTIPLPTLIVEVLRRQHAQQAKERPRIGAKWQETGFVFTTPIGTPIDPRNCTRLVQAACQRAGFRVVRLHDSRTAVCPCCWPSARLPVRRWRS